MKKLFILLTMLIVGIGSMWAIDVTLTSASQIKNSTFYDGSGNVQTSINWWNKVITKTSIPITLDFGSVSGISNFSGKFNVYGSKTLTITSPFRITGYTITGTPTANCTITPAGGSTTNWTANTSGTVTASGLNTYTTTIAFTGEADKSKECLIDITSFVITVAVTNLTDVSQISADKFYILYNNGRSQFMNVNNESGQVMLSKLPSSHEGLLPYIVRFVSNTSAKSDGNAYQLKFYDGTYLPWQSAGGANYVSANMGLGNTSNEGYLPVYANEYFTFQVYKGGSSRNYYFNGNNGSFTFWDNATDNTSKYLIYEVDGTDLQEIAYNLNIEGDKTSNNSRKLLTYKSLSIAMPTTTGMDKFFDYATLDFVTFSSTTASSDGSAISIPGTWNLPFSTTTLVDGKFPADAQFYRMHLRAESENKYAHYDATTGKILYVAKDATLTTADYFCFVGNGKNGFKVYNMAAGGSVVMGADNPSNNADIYMLGTGHPTHLWALHPNSGQGFTLRQTTGTSPGTDAYLHDMSNKFSYWHSSSALSDVGSGLVIEVANFGNVTYNVLLEAGGEIKATATASNVSNRVLTLPSDAARDFCTYTYYTDQACTNEITELPFGTTTVYVLASYSSTMPFIISTDFETATWYRARINTSKYLRANDSAKDGSGRYTTNSSYEYSDVYRWAFFGNPYDGIYVMNKGQGDGKYLYKGSQPEFHELADPTSDNKALWGVWKNTQGGFALQNVEGGPYWFINDNGGAGNLGYWVSTLNLSAAGSNWTVNIAPVSVAELSNNKKYMITCNRGSLSTYTSSGTSYLASPIKTTLGIKGKEFAIINYDDKYYLYSVDDKKFVTYESTTVVPLAESTSVFIAFEEANGKYAIKFNNSNSGYLNSSASYTYGIVINDTGGSGHWDDGNQYFIEEIGDFNPKEALAVLSGFNDIIAELERYPYGLGLGKYHVTDGGHTYYSEVNGIISGLKTAGYSSENLTTAQNLRVATFINKPIAGKFYRFKGGSNNKYISNRETTTNYANTTEVDQAIFYLDTDDSNNYLLSYATGLYNNSDKDNWNWGIGQSNAKNVAFAQGNLIGYYTIKSSDVYFFDYKNGYTTYIDRSTAAGTDVRSNKWTIEEVTSLPLETNADGYTTFSAPVPVTIPSDCNAFIAISQGDGVINLEQVTGNVAANTGLIISTKKYDDNDLTFNIVANGTDYSGRNLLVANVAANNIDETNNYFFGKYKGNYVFTKIDSDGTHTLAGHKAYLDGTKLAGTGARISISWDIDNPTGIDELKNDGIELKDGKYYQKNQVVIVRNGVKYNVAGQVIK